MTTMRLLVLVLVVGLLLSCAAGSYAQGRGGYHHGGGHGGPGWQGYQGHGGPGYGGPGYGHHNRGYRPMPQTVVYGSCGPVRQTVYYAPPCPPQPVYGVTPWGQVVIIGYR